MSSNPFVYIIGAVAIIGAFFVFGGSGGPATDAVVSGTATGSNVEVVAGKQIVTIAADEGYSPGSSSAKAGLPTVLRFKTANSFGCTTSIRIPTLRISEDLPSTGTTDIDVGTLAAGTLTGTCSMGMYKFAVVAS